MKTLLGKKPVNNIVYFFLIPLFSAKVTFYYFAFPLINTIFTDPDHVDMGYIQLFLFIKILIIIIISFFMSIIYFVWSVKDRKLIQNTLFDEYKIKYKMNYFYIFIFNQYYINYCINELADKESNADLS